MRLAVFEAVFRGELGDGLVGVVGDLGQHILEVVEGIDAPLAAGLDNGEEDGAALAAIGVAEQIPLAQGVVDGLSHGTGRQVGARGFPRVEHTVETREDGSGLAGALGGAQLRPGAGPWLGPTARPRAARPVQTGLLAQWQGSFHAGLTRPMRDSMPSL